MGNTVQIKKLTIGEGMPKICVPITGRTLDEIMEEAAFLVDVDFDLVEWRVDFFNDAENIEKVKAALKKIRTVLPDVPLIFTFRSKKEGGEKEMASGAYFELNKAIAETNRADVIDIELFNDEAAVREAIEAAHHHHVMVIVSNHDFHHTPAKEEIIARLLKAQELGADFPKIAVMPNSAADVLSLLEATDTMTKQYAKRPIITMAMAGQGIISRIGGEIFGSSITFGAAKKASAPGQINVDELRNVLKILHENL